MEKRVNIPMGHGGIHGKERGGQSREEGGLSPYPPVSQPLAVDSLISSGSVFSTRGVGSSSSI